MSNNKKFLPLSGREYPRFSAIKTFYRLPTAELHEDFDVAILGVPFDGGLSYRPGARFAPSHIRDISSLGRSYHWEHSRSVFSSLRCADAGDFRVDPLNLEVTYQWIEAQTLKWLQSGKRLLLFGGDHSITLPILRAYKKFLGETLALIHFDAHLDTYPAAWGHEYHHGSFLRHAIEEKLIDPKQTIHVGIRGPFAGGDDLDFVKTHGTKVMSNTDVKLKPLDDLRSEIRHIQSPTYISFDIDSLDPAYAPGTGTPVPGGLSSFEALHLLRLLKGLNIVGGDVVEVSPPYDQSQVTALAAMSVGYEILSLF
jgi:agmatinase/guanidinopropionase